MNSKRLKFGCHDFLNSKPLTYAITEKLIQPSFETVFAPPSALADMLKKGEVDFALIPAVEYLRIPGLKIVPGFSIASAGCVKTVLMFSDKLVEGIRKIAVDFRSRTSVALLKILFRKKYGRDIETVEVTGSFEVPPTMLSNADGALLIGDEAFQVDLEHYRVIDLSEEWHGLTGKPFVFAILCVRNGINIDEAVMQLAEAKAIGFENIVSICDDACDKIGISDEECRDYLLHRIKYDLDDEDIDGMKLFFKYASAEGAGEEKQVLFYGK
ncbi:MAG: menaquinone biosynthesis protein [Nitrospinota bacterium]|nr:menaquinone biosynthesis protein [Nitrospinota bacterium]